MAVAIAGHLLVNVSVAQTVRTLAAVLIFLVEIPIQILFLVRKSDVRQFNRKNFPLKILVP